MTIIKDEIKLVYPSSAQTLSAPYPVDIDLGYMKVTGTNVIYLKY